MRKYQETTMRAQFIDSTDTFKLTLFAYCGMPVPILDEGDMADMADCRSKAARLIREARKAGSFVSCLEPGSRWEIGEPEGCSLVPDSAGILSLRPVRIPAFPCWQCGDLIPEGESCSCQEPWGDEEEEPFGSLVDCGCMHACSCHEEETEEETEEEPA